MKNDPVFRRIFAEHPDILRGLLNDRLDRRGDRAIEDVEYLPSEQPPRVAAPRMLRASRNRTERSAKIAVCTAYVGRAVTDEA